MTMIMATAMVMITAILSNSYNCISSTLQSVYTQVHGICGIHFGARKLVLSEVSENAYPFQYIPLRPNPSRMRTRRGNNISPARKLLSTNPNCGVCVSARVNN